MKYLLFFTLNIFLFSPLMSQSFERGPSTNKFISLPLIADFNGDDKPDVAGISRFFSPIGNLRLHINSSDENTISFETVDLEISAFGNPGIGDFDNDNDIDMVIIEGENSEIVILLNNGDGTFETKSLESEVAYLFRTSDMDGDGDIDIVTLNGDNNSAYLMINQGNADFVTSTILSNVEDLQTLELEDIDGDNDVDIIVGFDDFFDGKIILLENQGSATFEEKIITENATGNLEKLQIIDIDKDGFKDVIYSSSSSSFIWAMINNGDETYTEASLVQASGTIRSFNVADYNTDGIFDILIGCNSAENTYHQGLSTTSLEYSTEVVTEIQPMFYIVNVDLDSDDDLDAVVSNGDFWWLVNELEQGFVNVTEQEEDTYKIYPNPFIDYINIDLVKNEMEISITNLLGQRVFQTNGKELPYNLEGLRKGCYLLSIIESSSGKVIQNSKIVKMK